MSQDDASAIGRKGRVGRAAEEPHLPSGRAAARQPSAVARLTETEQLAALIAHDVHRRTLGGVADLEVSVSSEGIRLRGRCATFYLKQLAQHAALDAAGTAPLVNDIEVAADG